MGGTLSEQECEVLFVPIQNNNSEQQQIIQQEIQGEVQFTSPLIVQEKKQQSQINKQLVQQTSKILKQKDNEQKKNISIEPKMQEPSNSKIENQNGQNLQNQKTQQQQNSRSLIVLNEEIKKYFPTWLQQKFTKLGKYDPPIKITKISQGVHQMSDGTYYQGSFDNGKKNGYGILLSKTELYEGYFENDMRKGWGRSIQIQSVRIGQWDDLSIIKNLKYETDDYMYEVKDDETCQYEDKLLIYVGQFANGQKNGKGELRFKSVEDKYIGQFKDDKFNGKGIYYYANGIIHEGTFNDGKMTGPGVRTYPDGRSYRGDFVNGQKHGNGIYQENNGNGIYDGQFQNNKKNGKGVQTINGIQLFGTWIDDIYQEDND